MYLENSCGDNFRLSILRYQFPQLTNDIHDVNWLLIRIDASLNGRSWTATDPSLLTQEVEKLIHWLEEISRGKPSNIYCSFIEPCLEFRWIVNAEKEPLLRLFFEIELRPPWHPSDTVGNEDVYIDFPIVNEQLLEASRSLRKQLEQYPPRKATGH